MLQLLRSWTGRFRLLSDVKKLKDKADDRITRIVDDSIQSGLLALKSGDRKAALHFWEGARGRHPDLVLESQDGLYLLIGLQRFDVAEALMQEGCLRQPRNSFFFEGAALVATRSGDDEEAVRRYATLRKKFPRSAKGYRHATAPLIKLGRLDEADRLLGRIAGNTRDAGLAIEYARLAMLRRAWPVALKRWHRVRDYFGHESAPLGLAHCHREMGRHDEAEHLLLDALKRPRLDSLACWIEMAFIAEGRGDWAEAARQWGDVRTRSPLVLDGYCRGALALAKCNREAEAEEILRAATEHFASSPAPWIEYARAAERRRITHEAEARWEQVRVRFPNESVIAG
jgi:predicted Zn-dependent protease